MPSGRKAPNLNRFGHLYTVNAIKLETGLRPNSAGIPYTLLLRIEAIGFPTFWLLLYTSPPGFGLVVCPLGAVGFWGFRDSRV